MAEDYYDDLALAPDLGVAREPALGTYDAPEEDMEPAFEPSRDIAPMDRRFFKELDESRLSARERLRLQTGYLREVDDVRAQRQKLEDERRKSMMDDLRIRQAQESLRGVRRQQAAANRASQTQRDIAEGIRAIHRNITDPEKKAQALSELEMEHVDHVATDPAVSRMFQTAKGTIQLPPAPDLTSTQVMDAVAKGVPRDVAARRDPIEMGFYMNLIRIGEKEVEAAKRNSTQELKEVTRERRRMVRDLVREDFKFMSETERGDYRVNLSDPNPYLTPMDHTRGRTLVRLVEGPEAYAAFERLPDAQKREYLNDLRLRTIEAEYNKFLDSDDEAEILEAKSLVPGAD